MRSGCDLGEGRAQSSREGSPSLCGFRVPWLTQSSGRSGPETTAVNASTEQTPVLRDAEDTGIWSQSGLD